MDLEKGSPFVYRRRLKYHTGHATIPIPSTHGIAPTPRTITAVIRSPSVPTDPFQALAMRPPRPEASGGVKFDRWMLLLTIGTFAGASPLMYFAQEYVSDGWHWLSPLVSTQVC